VISTSPQAVAIVNVSVACPEEEEFAGLRFAVFPIPEVLPEKSLKPLTDHYRATCRGIL
jgi:hypothetical protein